MLKIYKRSAEGIRSFREIIKKAGKGKGKGQFMIRIPLCENKLIIEKYYDCAIIWTK